MPAFVDITKIASLTGRIKIIEKGVLLADEIKVSVLKALDPFASLDAEGISITPENEELLVELMEGGDVPLSPSQKVTIAFKAHERTLAMTAVLLGFKETDIEDIDYQDATSEAVGHKRIYTFKAQKERYAVLVEGELPTGKNHGSLWTNCYFMLEEFQGLKPKESGTAVKIVCEMDLKVDGTQVGPGFYFEDQSV